MILEDFSFRVISFDSRKMFLGDGLSDICDGKLWFLLDVLIRSLTKSCLDWVFDAANLSELDS